MKKIKISLIIFFAILLLNGCGFKIMKKDGLKGINFVEVNTAGESRINYYIKNEILLYSNKESNRQVKIDLYTTKKKTIKEKNEKNEIIKYKLDVITTVNYNIIGSLEKRSFVVKKNGDYKIGERHIRTISNEKKLLQVIQKGLSEDIIEELSIKLNDL